MQTNSTLLRAWIILLAIFGMNSAFAQEPPLDSLGGKKVHLYLPTDEIDTLIVRNWTIPTRKTGKYWYTATLQGDRYNSNQGFFFANPQSNRFITKAGFANQEVQTARFMLADFQGKNEMWIIIDPSGPINATPTILLEPPKIVNILNPWETTGPRIVLPGGTFKSMVTRDDHCGWFMAFLLKPAEMTLHFQELNGAEAYGAGGRETATNFDMAAEFAAKGTPDTLGMNLWLDTEINTWLPVYPNKDGNCQYMMAATVRDFSPEHPDFDFGSQITGDFSATGIVTNTIGAGRRPVRSSASSTVKGLNIFNDFESWWRTDTAASTPAARRSYETCVDIPMSKTGDGRWEYDSYKVPARGFWPVEDFVNPNNTKPTASCYNNPNNPDQWTTNQPKTNMNFCMESHATFIYQPGQKFEFRGDDDVWVYINDKLVIDLGGIHIPKSDTVDLDLLGLTPGQTYNWDLFYCERQPCGSSLRIKTSIYFKQQRALEAVPDPANPGTFKIIKREGGKGSCAGQGQELTEVPATNLVYQLWNQRGDSVAALGNGPFYNGSIVIKTAPPNPAAEVTVDTSKIVSDLPPGNYRIVAFDPANRRVRAEVPYKVPARNLVQIHAPTGEHPPVPLGTLVRVILANKFNSQLVTEAQKYTPSTGGLIVYLDSLGTRTATLADFTTDATGYDTLWVTDTTMATADKQHLLSIPLTVPTLQLTFVVPKNKVEFEPPYEARNFPMGTLVPVIAANREAGTLVEKADPYTVLYQAGLLVYQNAAGTGPVVPSGSRLATEATGFDTLWVTGSPDATEDVTYTIQAEGPNPKIVRLTFLVPRNRVELEPPDSIRTTMNSVVRILAAHREPGLAGPKPEAKRYALDFPPGLQVFTSEDLSNEVRDGDSLTTSADGWDTLWVTADSTANGLVDKTFILGIEKSVNTVKITFTMPPLDLPKVLSAAMYDDDADGIPDRLEAIFDRAIAGIPPKEAGFRWPSSASPVAIPAAEIPSKVTGASLVHRGAFTATPSTSGEGVFTFTYNARNRDTTQSIPIEDKMGPILLKAEMVLGTDHDTLRLTFSETIGVGAVSGVPATLFGYKLLPDGEPVAFTPVSLQWNAVGTEAYLAFASTSTEAPRAGNLVRINDGMGLVGDLKGNTAGPASRFRLITGLKRSEIRTVTYREITPGPVLIREPAVQPTLQGTQSPVEEVVERTGRMGHLIKTDLGDYAVTDDFNTVSPSQVVLEYTASYFTNHGVPVASDRRVLACTDPIFQGDCIRNRGFLFVGWNYTSKDGARVGTGAYVARLRYQVKVAGAVKESGGLDQTWGVVRRE